MACAWARRWTVVTVLLAVVASGCAWVERVSVDSAGHQANDASYQDLSVSADGRYVAFSSFASNLVAGDTNDITDVFVRDTAARTTTRVSVDSAGNQSDSGGSDPAMSPDGRYVAFVRTTRTW